MIDERKMEELRREIGAAMQEAMESARQEHANNRGDLGDISAELEGWIAIIEQASINLLDSTVGPEADRAAKGLFAVVRGLKHLGARIDAI